MLLILLSSLLAWSAEVVWIGPDNPELRERVVRQAGASQEVLQPLDLRAAATAWSDADEQALRTLEAALKEARTYETRLDGELVIMRDLERPVAAVGLLRDPLDRAGLFAALAYQGFAVNRYFADTLAEDEEAAPYRVEFGGVAVERAWRDAVALQPEHEVTPYEIAEAPQRLAYGRVRDHLAGALPASLTPGALPAGARLLVDGRETQPGPSGNIKVRPGRHLVHAELEGRVVARWDVTLDSGSDQPLDVALTDALWDDFLGRLRDGAEAPWSPPEALRPCIEALGGEVHVLVNGPSPALYAVSASEVRPLALPRVTPPQGEAPSARPASLAVGALTGWFNNDDFYFQDQTQAPTFSLVNAVAVGVYASADLDVGPVRMGAGVDLHFTPGPKHVARVGSTGSSFRPYPHVAVGHRVLQVTGGFVFPWHPAAGLRLTAPLVGPVELRGAAVTGFKRKLARELHPAYRTGDLFTVVGGVGLRL